VRHRKTRSQYDLSRTERKINVREAFALHPALAGRPDVFTKRSFLLVDDIGTTLSTLEACGTLLREAGAASVKALVLARDL